MRGASVCARLGGGSSGPDLWLLSHLLLFLKHSELIKLEVEDDTDRQPTQQPIFLYISGQLTYMHILLQRVKVIFDKF